MNDTLLQTPNVTETENRKSVRSIAFKAVQIRSTTTGEQEEAILRNQSENGGCLLLAPGSTCTDYFKITGHGDGGEVFCHVTRRVGESIGFSIVEDDRSDNDDQELINGEMQSIIDRHFSYDDTESLGDELETLEYFPVETFEMLKAIFGKQMDVYFAFNSVTQNYEKRGDDTPKAQFFIQRIQMVLNCLGMGAKDHAEGAEYH